MPHKKLIAIDFDGVLHSDTTPWTDAGTISDGPTPGAIQFLKDLVDDGRFDVVIVSSRLSHPEGRHSIWSWLRDQLHLELHPVAADFILEHIQYSATRPPAFLTLDDRAWNFQGQWPSLDRIAGFLPWNKRPAHLRPDPETAMAVADSLLMQIGQIAKDAGCPDGEAPLDFIRARMQVKADVQAELKAMTADIDSDCMTVEQLMAIDPNARRSMS